LRRIDPFFSSEYDITSKADPLPWDEKIMVCDLHRKLCGFPHWTGPAMLRGGLCALLTCIGVMTAVSPVLAAKDLLAP
jgi:hypothetical protein